MYPLPTGPICSEALRQRAAASPGATSAPPTVPARPDINVNMY